MPSNDREVFRHFRDDPELSPELASLAYAAYASQRYDWVELFETRKGRPPNSDEVDEWIASLPLSRLEDIKRSAADTFDLAATAYMADRTEEAMAQAVRESVLGEVRELAAQIKAATSFRSTWLPNLFVGVIASFAFALIVLVGAAIYQRDPSLFALFKR